MTGLAILLPGQGGQHAAMFDRVREDAAAQEVLTLAASVLGGDPVEIASGPAIFENRLAQPLLCAVELATWAALNPKLPEPLAFAGYSVGELTAYGCAGALEPRVLLELAAKRAELMDATGGGPSGMLAVKGLTQRKVEALCGEFKGEIAIMNGRDHFVLGASRDDLEQLEAAVQQAGAHTVRRLAVDVASHTPRLSSASVGFETALRAATLSDPRIPVLAGLNGQVVRERETAVATLAAQISAPLDWAACLDTAQEMGCRVFLELGPGNALSRMMREAYPEAAARSVEEFRSLDGVADWVARQSSH
jgi:[acyl-carrier-protein] S-malonyltransferase